MIIAIDGPAGSGKSTVAKLVAKELGFNYLDTGAMYRAVAFRALQEGIALEGGDELVAIANDEFIEFGLNGEGSVAIGGLDVTGDIRTADVDRAVSPVSACPEVRVAMTEQQRRIGRTADVVMEGRDIGTVVFPDAELKVFLEASPEVRAKRRALQNAERGIGETDYEVILADIKRRDAADSTRETAPLKPADDAVILDTSDMTIEEVVGTIVNWAIQARDDFASLEEALGGRD